MEKIIVFLHLFLIGALCNEAPRFTHDMNGYQLSESTPVNTLVYVLEGNDPEGEPVTFGINSDDFAVLDPTSGEVTLIRQLNYETRSQVVARVSISDGVNVVENNAYIQINDENDNPPSFTQQTYFESVSESTSPGSILIADISVTDVDTVGQPLTVTCQENELEGGVNICDIFGIESNIAPTFSLWRGNLILRRSLNYEDTPVYTILLRAFDGVDSVVQSVVISVRDIQDSPPVFSGALAATLTDNVQQGSVVLTISAQDGDSTAARSISYSLAANPGDLFEIDSTSGEIRAAQLIDRDNPYLASGYINLMATASEVHNGQVLTDSQSSTTTQVTLSFQDTNDNAPTITPPVIVVDISESVNNGYVLATLTVTDVDQGVNSFYEVILDNDLNTQNTFAAVPSSGQGVSTIEIQVRDTSLIDYESTLRTYNLIVVARETQTVELRSAVASITVNVKDVNDNPPVFAEDLYEVSVIETAPGGTPLITITATDLDTGDNGVDSIWYRTIGDGSHLFNTHYRQGLVTIATCSTPGSGDCLDYEQQRVYELTFQAADSFGEGFLTSVPLVITILDDNDNAPNLIVGNYTSYIEEGETIPNPNVIVQAEDADDTSIVTYTIMSGNTNNIWQMDSISGFISAPQPVQYEDTPNGQGYFQMTVRATDGRYSDTGQVTIYVTDANDNPPVFIPTAYYEEWISEDTPPGTTIVTVTALDADPPTSDNGIVRYQITMGSVDKFTINTISGVITVAPSATFNYNVQNRYEMTVIAYDMGVPPLTATGTVVVNIRDANNQDPYFEPSVIEEDVNDNTPVNAYVRTLTAIDPDADAQLKYYMVDPRYAWNLNNGAVDPSLINFMNWFRVDADTGNVYVNSPLSQQEAARLSLTIEVRDISGGPDQKATATLLINILHYNDAPPVFEQPWSPSLPYLNITVREEIPRDSYVTIITATDPDGVGIDRYEIISNPGVHFNNNPNTGSISIQNPIDYETIQYLEFVVIATDSGDPQLTSTATVQVNVININDNHPEFNPTYYNETISENSPAGTVIVQVFATDRDLGDYGDIRYELLNNNLNVFSIDPMTGLVTVQDPTYLDRELYPVFHLSVQAYDSPNSPEGRRYTIAELDIYLTDVNDNPPNFYQDIYYGRIHETAPVNTYILNVTATDPDTDNNGRITYYIIGGNDLGLFVIDQSKGEIASAFPLTGNDGNYNLTVGARDGGYPTQNKTALVIITVEPANDNPPEWQVPNDDDPDTATTHVMENQPPGTNVLQVVARDYDPDLNGFINYGFLINNQFVEYTDEFQMNRVSGQISTRVPLDREEQDMYYVMLIARDLGTPSMNTTIGLTIIVDDVEDNNPEFPKFQNCCTIPYEFSVAENLPSGQLLGAVSATDMDIGNAANIIYYIVGGNTDESFIIDNTTGVISTQQMLDHEQYASYVLTVVAYNRADQNPHAQNYPLCDPMCQQPWQVLVYITVTDENDSPPTFEYGIYNVCVSIDAPIGKSVTTIRATDFDTNTGTIIYTMTSLSSTSVPTTESTTGHVPADDNFQLMRENGTIFTTTLMSRYESHYFTMGIMANDSGPVPGNTVARIWVTEPAYELTLTFKVPPDEVRGHEMDIIRWVQGELGEDTVVCVNDIRYYINPEYTVIPGWTDVLIHVIGGDDYDMIPPYIVVDMLPIPDGDGGGTGTGTGDPGTGGGDPVSGGDGGTGTGTNGLPAAIVGGMELTGIRPTYTWWEGFNIHPILIVVIVIFLLLLLGLLLLCCLAWCLAGWCGGEEPTKKYIQPFMVPMGTLERLYEDQELNMKLDQIDDIKLKGTINEGFDGDEIDHRTEHNGMVLSNGHVTQTTTQSDYQMSYEHTRTHEETLLGGGGGTLDDGRTPMIIAELEPRDSDSGIRSTSGLYVHSSGRSTNQMTQNYHSMPTHLNTAGLTVPRPQVMYPTTAHSAIGAVLMGSHTNLSQHSYSARSDAYRSEAYSPAYSPLPPMPRSADPYVTTWPRGNYVSELQITHDEPPATIHAEPVLVTNENPVLVTDTLDFPEGMYQGEILLGTYRPPHQQELRSEGMQIYNTHPGVYDSAPDDHYY